MAVYLILMFCCFKLGNKLVESLIRDKGNTNFNSDLFSSAEFLVFKIQNVFVFSKLAYLFSIWKTVLNNIRLRSGYLFLFIWSSQLYVIIKCPETLALIGFLFHRSGE